MNILVTGANGQLGNEMRKASLDSSNNYIFTDVAELDITDRAAVDNMVRALEIGAIVNCAAYTNVDKAESDEDTAMLLNAEAPAILADAARDNRALLIHISTDYVFGGNLNNTPCREDQPANPTGVYGKTKLEGEKNVIASGADYIILRTAWLYSEYGRNFVKTMLQLTADKTALKVVFDQVGTPTYALDLANAIVDIIDNDKYKGNSGIYHFSNEGVCSWYDFTKLIAELANHNDCEIEPCHSDEFPSPVTRPSYSVLDKTKYKRTFGMKVPYWTDSLRKCLKNLNN